MPFGDRRNKAARRRLNMRASICLATYNGAKYIKEQLDSILRQIAEDDEIIICDDGSTDGTRDFLREIDDPRVTILYNQKNLGHVRNFEKLLLEATGDILFLCDQDDLWDLQKISIYKRIFAQDASINLIASNFSEMASDGHLIGENLKLGAFPFKSSFLRVGGIFFGRLPYFGCTMAFRRSVLRVALPIPIGVEAHDIWLALIANTLGKCQHLTDKLVTRRIHSTNLTPTKRRPLNVILVSRIQLLTAYLKALIFRSWKR